MRRFLAVLLLLFSATTARAAAPAQAGRSEAGRSIHIAGWWFQYLGEDGRGGKYWLYPHVDGIHEIFRAPQDGLWIGDLGTRFTPGNGSFENIFNGAEVLNEFLTEKALPAQKQEAAKLLKLWLAIHPAPQAPYYARDSLKKIEASVTPEMQAWVDEQLAVRKRLRERVKSFGVEVPALQTPIPAERGPQEYYRQMARDGYLDIAVVGGNLYNQGDGTYNSWKYIEQFREALVKQHGFKSAHFRSGEDETLGILPIKTLGQPVTVRLHSTGGSLRSNRIIRGVANFIEGLAHADLFIYMGHSNYFSGAYYISEADTLWSRFQIGLKSQKDLTAKCHLLRTHPYQLVCFQSCSSYRKYAQPIRWHLARTWPEQPGRMGFMGTSEMCLFADFIPRYTKLIELVLKEQGARTIQDALNAIQPKPNTPPMILRGFLQSPASFILPEGVTVTNLREEPAERGHHVLAEGSDGRTYRSTEVFPQNFAGEIVQVAPANDGLLGLTKDGRVYFCGRNTGGSAQESGLTATSDTRFAFIGTLSGHINNRPILLGTDGRIYRQDDRSGKPYLTREQPPSGVTFTAIGEDATHRMIAQDEKRVWYGWDNRMGFVELKDAPNAQWEPSLLGNGTKGVLYAPGDLPTKEEGKLAADDRE